MDFDPRKHLARYGSDPLGGWYDGVKRRHAEQLWRFLRRWLPERPAVLEVGPGHGHFARVAAGAGTDYDAIEPADRFRAGLEEHGLSVTAEIVPPISRESGRYDLVHASMLLENLPSTTEAGGFVMEAERILKPGGVLCLIFPNYLTWGRFFFDEHYTHNFVTTPRRVGHLLTSQGFRVERIDHVLGWFWVKESLLRNLLRLLACAVVAPLHWNPVGRVLEAVGLGDLRWKVRKTLFEAIVLVAIKTAAPER